MFPERDQCWKPRSVAYGSPCYLPVMSSVQDEWCNGGSARFVLLVWLYVQPQTGDPWRGCVYLPRSAHAMPAAIRAAL
jgi:hypothetical protein